MFTTFSQIKVTNGGRIKLSVLAASIAGNTNSAVDENYKLALEELYYVRMIYIDLHENDCDQMTLRAIKNVNASDIPPNVDHAH
jgi:hypothetical protein